MSSTFALPEDNLRFNLRSSGARGASADVGACGLGAGRASEAPLLFAAVVLDCAGGASLTSAETSTLFSTRPVFARGFTSAVTWRQSASSSRERRRMRDARLMSPPLFIARHPKTASPSLSIFWHKHKQLAVMADFTRAGAGARRQGQSKHPNAPRQRWPNLYPAQSSNAGIAPVPGRAKACAH